MHLLNTIKGFLFWKFVSENLAGNVNKECLERRNNIDDDTRKKKQAVNLLDEEGIDSLLKAHTRLNLAGNENKEKR